MPKQKMQQQKKKEKKGGKVRVSASPGKSVHVQPSLVQRIMTPLVAMTAMAPTPRAVDDDKFVTIQATHNLMNQRTRKEKSDIMILNNVCGTTSEDLEDSVQTDKDLTGRVINVLWNVPGAYSKTTTDTSDPPVTTTTTTFDTRGTMQKLRNFGFTVKNTYSHRVWVHANTPVSRPEARQTVYSRICGFSVAGKRAESIELAPGATAKYNIPTAALSSGQCFSEFVEKGGSAGMALGRTLMLASMLIEVPTDYIGPDGSASQSVEERKGGQLVTIMPYAVYDYTELETEFSDIESGEVIKKQPFTITSSNHVMDLYGVTHTDISATKQALEEIFLRNEVSLEHTEDGELVMMLTDDDGKRRVSMIQSGLEVSVPALGIVHRGVVECQYRSHEGHIYLWDVERGEPMVVNRVNKLPSAMAGTIVNVHPSLTAPGVYSINWGAFFENAAAAAWEIVKSFL